MNDTEENGEPTEHWLEVEFSRSAFGGSVGKRAGQAYRSRSS